MIALFYIVLLYESESNEFLGAFYFGTSCAVLLGQARDADATSICGSAVASVTPLRARVERDGESRSAGHLVLYATAESRGPPLRRLGRAQPVARFERWTRRKL